MFLLSVFVIFIYAHSAPIDPAITVAIDPQQKFDDSVSQDNLLVDSFNTFDTAGIDDEKDKKLVKKTAAVTAAGASRGAFSATAYCFSGRTAMGHGVS